MYYLQRRLNWEDKDISFSGKVMSFLRKMKKAEYYQIKIIFRESLIQVTIESDSKEFDSIVK